MRFYKSAALTANQRTSNLVSAIPEIEWIRRPSRIRVSGSESLNTGGATVTLIVGGRALLQDAALGGANRSHVLPDDILGEWIVQPGSQTFLIIQEILGGTPTYFIQLDVDPVA